MSEEQSEYITDAMEMIGLTEPRQIIQEVSGFVPVFEVIMKHYKDHMTALVFGRMWQYCGMADGVCRASLGRIGKDLEISAPTVMRHAEKLVNDGFLIDTTPDRRNSPHVYADGGKVIMKSQLKAQLKQTVTQSKATVTESNATVTQSQLIKQDNTKKDNGDIANRKVDAMLDMANFPGAKREIRLNAILSYIGSKLGVMAESRKWQEFAKFVDDRQLNYGESLERFISWMTAQKGYEIQYWPPGKMQDLWPQAFVEQKPMTLEEQGWR